MQKPTTILLIALLAATSAYAEMKCEAGKCGAAMETPKKILPKTPEKTKQEKTLRTQKVTVKQLFNVITTRISKKVTAPSQVNYGYIVPDESKVFDITAWYSGFVVELYANTHYQKVKKGEVLAKVYSPEVYKAKQDYLNALNFNAKRPSPSMVKSSRVKLQLLNVNEQEIKAIEETKRVDRYTDLVAPASGWIFEKNINEGSSFKSGSRLFKIVNTGTVWLEAKLYPNELEKLNTLMHFTVRTEGIDTTFKAEKSLLYPRLDPKEATATLRLLIENRNELLKPGMYATAYASSKEEARLLIPRTAVIRKNGQWYVFLATEFKGEYEPLKVELKPLDNQYFEVLDGLKEGDEVANNALFMMDSDAQINGVY